ncbi:Uncharacterised protein [Bordetella pertussis]|nr:Uncharacterised protein [Bordetella pertussis]
MATDDWFGMVSMRIQRPSTRIWFTALNDWDPPDTCMTASVLPWVGRIAPIDSGIQSICVFIRPLMAPCRSGELQIMPSAHRTSSCSSRTLGWSSLASSTSGSPDGLNSRVSPPSARRSRAASSATRRL